MGAGSVRHGYRKNGEESEDERAGIYYRGPAQYEVKIQRKGVAINHTFDTFADALQFKPTTVSKIDGDTFIDKTREKQTTLRALKCKDVHETHIYIPRSTNSSARDVPRASAASACIHATRSTTSPTGWLGFWRS
ncbi:hypothetical protein GCM10022398_02990 [Acetobacter lovaniensis]|jgi:hypothetical protein|uniref:Uncharacterized protein n=1 Tax=Acetobacter lovaniensis TaxID=104100 RepID=A0A841QBH3_9PROT|nr:hypothetical protein [Acetobacter lovaniensis]GBQ72220.1 hypothetical protein AA0474_2645 [Acetobacter lovaniensis NRIC 0474]